MSEEAAAAAVQTEGMRRARAEREAAATASTTYRGRKASVTAIGEGKALKVDVDGTIVDATIDRSLGAVRVGDTVDVVYERAAWTVVKIVTWHEPEPVLTKADLPPKPSVTVPNPPAGAGTPGNLTIQNLPPLPITITNLNDAQFELNRIWNYMSITVYSSLQELMQTWLPRIIAAEQKAVAAGNAVRTTAQQLGGVNDFAEAAGAAGEGALESGANAAVEAGTAVRVQGISLTAMPENIDRAGYEAWTLDTQSQVTRILSWRTRTIIDLRAAVNRALKYEGLAELSAFPQPPDVTMDDLTWGTAANNWESVDNWCRDRILVLVSAIDRVRTKESLGPGTYTGGTTVWSGASYEAARPQAIVSTRNFRIRCSEMGTALMEAVKIINSQQTPNSPTEPQKKIQGISLSAMPDNIDRSPEYDVDNLATRAQIGRILAWRIRAVLDLRDATNRARAHFSLPPQSTASTPPDPLVDDITWAAAVSKIQAVDTWTSGVLNALVTNVNQVRAQASMGGGTWSGGTLTWSGSTYAAARPSLIVSMRNFRIRCSETGTALMEAVKAVNG